MKKTIVFKKTFLILPILFLLLAIPASANTFIPFNATFTDNNGVSSDETLANLTGTFYLTAIACRQVGTSIYENLSGILCPLSDPGITGYLNSGIVQSSYAGDVGNLPLSYEGFLIGDYLPNNISALNSLATIMGSVVTITVDLVTTVITTYWPFVLVISILFALFVVFTRFVTSGISRKNK